jgi:hypothetical protein
MGVLLQMVLKAEDQKPQLAMACDGVIFTNVLFIQLYVRY